MPTGYTAAIADGITFDQFVWDCARAFGALVLMRDAPQGTPIPERFEPSPYYAKRVSEAQAKLSHLRGLTPEQAHAECVVEYQRALDSHTKRLREKEELRAEYTAMLGQVDAWRAPSPDHEGLKEFMQKQIRESIEWDCSTKYVIAPTLQTTDAWLAISIDLAGSELKMAEESLREEIERTESRNRWLSALRASVPYPPRAEAP